MNLSILILGEKHRPRRAKGKEGEAAEPVLLRLLLCSKLEERHDLDCIMGEGRVSSERAMKHSVIAVPMSRTWMIAAVRWDEMRHRHGSLDPTSWFLGSTSTLGRHYYDGLA